MEQNILSTPDLSPLEQEVLEEYERLASNMKQVRRLVVISPPGCDFVTDGVAAGECAG
jgi:hypothetical protein